MIFIDTGPLLARYLTQDQHHSDAIVKWSKINNARQRCVSSNFVLDECFTLLARRAGYHFAAQKAKNIYASEWFDILRPCEQDELVALGLFEKFSDQKVSYTDCISFQLIKHSNISKVFTFDRHFQLAGFHVF